MPRTQRTTIRLIFCLWPVLLSLDQWVITFSFSGEFTVGHDEKVSIWRVPWWDESQKQLIYYVHVSSNGIAYNVVFVAPGARTAASSVLVICILDQVKITRFRPWKKKSCAVTENAALKCKEETWVRLVHQ
ncbi:hypothetical protein BDN67DRAFT_404076 [Paxillus ammoniavirescens]|nr:hypothetical protein BDN67DRAFT_404076 [Paxillus ammoniavirescens]